MAKQTVLLIDYEPRSIERFRQPLTEAGYSVEVATDGITGIEAFHRLNPDMVLVEAMIPKKHGFEVCQELKRTPHGRRTPILITTGVYKGRKYRTQALHIYGCDEYIEKPIAPEQLLAVVGRFFTGGTAAAPTGSARSDAAASTAASAEVTARGTVAAAPVPAESAPARTPVPKAGVMPTSVTKDFTEEEIMARLDAILPGGEIAGSIADAPPTLALAPETPAPLTTIAMAPEAAIPVSEMPLADEPFPEIPDTPSTHDGAPSETADPFAQMQAELTAELGSISAALALEPAPVFDEPFPSVPADDSPAPSLLDSLPRTSAPMPSTPAEAPPTGLPPATPAPTSTEAPGQLVNFDAKRSRRKKSGRKGAERRETSPSSATAQPAAPPPAPSKPIAQPPVAETLTLPPGTLVESDLGGPAKKKGVSVWIWAAVAVAALAAVYFLFLRGNGISSQEEPASSVLPSGTTAHSSRHPQSGQPSASDASTTSPAAEAGANTEAPLVLNSVAVPPPAPSRPSSETSDTASKGKSVPLESEAAHKPPSAPLEALPAPATSTPKGAAKSAATNPPSAISSWHASAPDASAKPVANSKASGSAKAVPGTSAPTAAAEAVVGVETSAGVDAVPTDELVTRPAPSRVEPGVAPGTLVDEADVDTAPVSLSRKAPTYSMQARQLRIQGTVVMKVLVNERGTVDQVVLVEGVPGADLNTSAMNAAKSWTYRPATKGGVPVKVWKVEQVAFKL